MADRSPLLLAAHGSRDAASAATMRALAERVGWVWPAPVRVAFLDFDEPSIPDALDELAAVAAAPVVVPALLTHAYHGRVDLPAVLDATFHPVRLARALGPDPLLVRALRRRLSELEDARRADGVILIAAGTSDATARSTVEDTAAGLGRWLGVSGVAAYASAAGPTPGEAVVALRAAGAARVVVASYFLAPGRLYEAARRSAMAAGAVAVAAPLGTSDDLVRVVVARAQAALLTPARMPLSV